MNVVSPADLGAGVARAYCETGLLCEYELERAWDIDSLTEEAFRAVAADPYALILATTKEGPGRNSMLKWMPSGEDKRARDINQSQYVFGFSSSISQYGEDYL